MNELSIKSIFAVSASCLTLVTLTIPPAMGIKEIATDPDRHLVRVLTPSFSLKVSDSLNKASLNIKDHDYAGALRNYGKALDDCEFESSRKLIFCMRAGVYQKLKQYDQAIADFTAAKKGPTDYSSPLSVAECYYQLKLYEKALAECKGALDIQPDCLDAIRLRGKILYQEARYREALPDLQEYCTVSGAPTTSYAGAAN